MQQISRTLSGAPVLAIAQSEGVGATVRRSIGSQSCRNFTPFLLLDHFKVSKGGGFPDHPHRGMTTVTYMLKGGAFQHEDSKGHKGIIRPGDLQWMVAGRGIMHAEMPLFEENKPDPEGLQLWIDIPKDNKMTEPSYQELTADQVPVAHYSEDVDIKVISGQAKGSSEQGIVKSSVKPISGCHYYDITMKKAGVSFWQDIPQGWSSFIYTLNGNIIIGNEGEKIKQEPFHTLTLTSSNGQNGVRVESASDDVHFVLIAGEPLQQPIYQRGPFVLASENDVYKAFLDYRQGQNGFEGSHTWRSDIGGQI